MRPIYVTLVLLAATRCAAVDMPKAVDNRLAVELFAAEPDIVTPTGLAVDSAGRVLVVESHTHFRPQNYKGPPADRIRMLEDTNGDGRADRFTTFYEGTRSTMSLAIDGKEGVVVATRNEIFRLADCDADGQAEQRTPLVRMETAGDYPHNGLSGFAFDTAGRIYFGMGENLGVAYKLIGTDGSTETGSEGGHIFRCDSDGGHVERFATGFWNPFHLAFDSFGRLFAVDNDPDSLPPCRLLHVVQGGNYGYKFRNGRRGLHPFTAWNGELPGTLPMVAGTDEAPSGVLEYRGGNLPHDYVGELLVTSWGDHRLERFHLEPRGASLRSTARPLVTGGENFRPVGIAAAPDGTLYVSDWVDKSYEVHGKGRIWRLRVKYPAVQRDEQVARDKQQDEVDGQVQRAVGALDQRCADWLANKDVDIRTRAQVIRTLATRNETAAVRQAFHSANLEPELVELCLTVLPNGSRLSELLLAVDRSPTVRAARWRRDSQHSAEAWAASVDNDPFVAQAARGALARMNIVSGDFDPSELSPARRLSALLVLRESGGNPGELLRRSLRDPDPQVRFVAVQWVGEERLAEYRPELDQVLAAGPVSSLLFAGYLAAQEKLDRPRNNPNDEWAGEQYVARALQDPKSLAEVRRWALRVLRPDHPLLSIAQLREWIGGPDAGLQLEAVRSLRDNPSGERAKVLAALAADATLASALRAEAIMGLGAEDRKLLVELAADKNAAVRQEALRSLIGVALTDDERHVLESVAAENIDCRELVARLLGTGLVGTGVAERPAATDIDAWLKLLEGPADPHAGERVFFSSHTGACYRCHSFAGRGARVGPELTTTGHVLERRRLIESILQPSKEVAPQFSVWSFETADGRVVTGMLLGDTGPTIRMANERGETFELRADEIESRVAQSRSVMPDGLERTLTVQEFRDLLAFLRAK